MTIPKRNLDTTGCQVTMLGLGGWFSVARHDHHKEAVDIINRAIELGIKYIDTYALYGYGASEINIGRVMCGRLGEVFLASKRNDHSYDGSMPLIQQSLHRLQTAHIELYQHHFLVWLGQVEQHGQKKSARQAFEEPRDRG